MTAGLPWYAHSIEDYERKTAHLTMLEHGAYRLLMDHYYKLAAPLPAKLEQVHRICRAIADEEKAAVSAVLSEFFHLRSAGWHNDRAEEELARMAEISQKRSNSAKNSHFSRKKSSANADANGNANADTLNTTQSKSSLRSDLGAPQAALPTNPAAVSSRPKPEKNQGTRWPSEARVPAEWHESAHAACHDAGLDPPDLRVETGKFERYWASKAGALGRKANWEKTFINWIIRAAEDAANRAKTGGKSGASTAHQRGLEGLARLVDDADGRLQDVPGQRPPRLAIGGDG